MILNEFCKKLGRLSHLSAAQKALAILWFFDEQKPGTEKTVNELVGILKAERIGNPNTTWLAAQISKTGCVFQKKNIFRLKEHKKPEIVSWIRDALGEIPVEIESASQYFPEVIWKKTRGYIERICIQLNGCVYYCFYDAAAVLIRRLTETLIIECFEHLHRELEIKDSNGNYLMLSGLVGKCLEATGLPVGRESKKALNKIKTLGDRSAHNRRFNARKTDLEEVREGLRIMSEELIHIANLYSS